MFPTDSEFSFLYLSYIVVFLYFSLGYFLTKIKSFKLNLIVFSVYTLFMIYIFSDENNFKYGGSLSVLFYGLAFLILHLIIYGIIELVKALKR
jgi:hypothetical protein